MIIIEKSVLSKTEKSIRQSQLDDLPGKTQVSLINFLMQLVNNVTKDKGFSSLLWILP